MTRIQRFRVRQSGTNLPRMVSKPTLHSTQSAKSPRSRSTLRSGLRRFLCSLGGVTLILIALVWTAAAKKKSHLLPTAPPPRFSKAGGIYTSNVVLHLDSTMPEAKVLFTTNGDLPTESSPVWQGSLTISNNTTIRARLSIPDLPLGPIGSETYLFVPAELQGFRSDLPVVILSSPKPEFSRDAKQAAHLRVVSSSTTNNSLLGPTYFEGRVLANIRGRASLRYPKRSYTLKLIDEDGENQPFGLLGLSRDDDFILYAPYPDKTLMRDVLAYELGREMGHWTPRTQFVEVFVSNGSKSLSSEDYMGVYVLEERIKRHPSRVNIQKLGPTDNDEPEVSGGYIFKKDHVDRGYFGPPDLLGGGNFVSSNTNKAGFPTQPGGFPADPKGFLPTYRPESGTRESNESSSSSSRRVMRTPPVVTNSLTDPVLRTVEAPPRSIYYDEDGSEIVEKMEPGFSTLLRTNQFYWVEPEEDEVTSVQRAWLKNYLDRLESVLYSDRFKDPDRGYRTFIDTRSFIDYHLIVEVSKNVDGHRFSTFFTKDRGSKIRLEPMWDWNLSFGNCNGKQGWSPEYWLWPQLTDTEYGWFRRLFEDPDFGQEYVDRWTELRKTTFVTERILRRVDEFTQLLASAQERNFARWPILGKSVNPNYFVGETYAEEVRWMKDWIRSRLEWIDAQFPTPPQILTTSQEGGPLEIRWTPSKGDVYYTLNGVDPRESGGELSSKALRAEKPITLKAGEELFARRFLDKRWSGPLTLKNTPTR